jgi:hemoglobin
LIPVKVGLSARRYLPRMPETGPQTNEAAQPATPFDRIGGHPAMRRITDRFYDLMEQDPAYAELRAIHAADLAPMREALPSFLAGWSGGPRHWFEANPGKCMVSMHAPFSIDRQTADQWAEAMTRAIAESDLPDREIADAMSDVLTRMAKGMVRG